MFSLLRAFFGLSPEYRTYLYRQIHEIVFNGNGGYSWETVYNMPIWLRRFTFNTMKEFFEQQNKTEEELPAAVRNKISPPDVVAQAITPSYSTKASKK